MNPLDQPKRVLFLSGHHIASDRRAGFHHLAYAFRDLGWEVTFVTTGLSGLSYMKPDHRRRTFRFADRNRPIPLDDGLVSYVWFTTWHPANTRSSLGNAATRPLFRHYGRLRFRGLDDITAGVTVVIVESSYGLFLVPRLRSLLPAARFVYRQSDDLDALGAHPALADAERRALRIFDLISVPDQRRLERFVGNPKARVDNHGIDRELFDVDSDDPYAGNGFATQAIFIGVDALDRPAVAAAARGLPDWAFHLVGPWSTEGMPPNVFAHGEMPFGQTIPYLTHADVGLHTIVRPRAYLFRESLKVVQYTYCRLPIVAEREAAASWPHVFPYSAGDPESVIAACRDARTFPRESIARGHVRSWTELAGDLADGEPSAGGPAGPDAAGRGITIVIPTLADRPEALRRAVASAVAACPNVLVVSQGTEGRVAAALRGIEGMQGVRVMHRPEETGASRARNAGLAEVATPWVMFLDDDAELLPPFASVATHAAEAGEDVQVIAWRVADEKGRDISRYREMSTAITVWNHWNLAREHSSLWRTDALLALGGFDEEIGPSRWPGAEECTDLMIRLLASGRRGRYVAVYASTHPGGGHLEADKARSYGRGAGHVIRKHVLRPASWPFTARAVAGLGSLVIPRRFHSFPRGVKANRARGMAEGALRVGRPPSR